MGQLQESAGALGDAKDSFAEALSLMFPMFLSLPDVHAPLMMTLVLDHLRSAEAANLEPNWEVIAPVIAKLEELKEKSGDAD
jgi:hypothetical protein